MRSVVGPKVVEELLKWVSWVGLPQEIITDQAIKSMSHVMKSLCIDSAHKASVQVQDQWAGGKISWYIEGNVPRRSMAVGFTNSPFVVHSAGGATSLITICPI